MVNVSERREALKQLLGLFVTISGVGAFFSGCGSSPSPSPNPPQSNPNPGPTPQGGEAASACVTNGTATTVEGDPLHMLVVPKEDVAAGVQKSYHIQGQENHDHVVTLTPQNFTVLQNGQSIRLRSGLSIGPVVSHFHFVDVACATA